MTGVYCFDTWLRRVRAKGIKIIFQYHDEICFKIPIGKEEETRALLLEAIKETNEELKLNVQLGISVDFGQSYSDIH